jgi:Permuted papain-like amidase enzyme, YaeF/YiiX, C92 family
MKRKGSTFIAEFLLSVIAAFPLLVHAAGATATPPAAALLQAGDLVWPKKPGAIVPYNSRPGEAGERDAMRWQKEKEAYLDEVRREPNPSPQEKERYSTLQKMTYEEFVSSYLADRPAGQPATFGVGNLSVGHVGIIEITDGKPFVLEAIMGLGVRRISYADWLRDRPDELVWLGRLKGVPSEKRSAVAKRAAEQIGKPYNFWDFDLKDTSGFYCSKLAWLSVLLGAGFPPDDNPNPERVLWYSPKQLMKSNYIDLIVNPNPY